MERLGVIGKPSDWLIASEADAARIRQVLDMELVEIPISEVTSLGRVDGGKEGALRIYERLKEIIQRQHLTGLTLRCFDLLSTVCNTGCLALAQLNAEGVPAACEGDIPALLSMALAKKVSGFSGFQVNAARILETGERCQILFAHCTVPLNMVNSFEYTTHFESGIGVALHGELPTGDYTLLKVSGKLDRIFAADVQLTRNQYEANLCRSQVWIDAPIEVADYLLHNPIANHHILLPGHHAGELIRLFHERAD